jgi:hypothetical protein
MWHWNRARPRLFNATTKCVVQFSLPEIVPEAAEVRVEKTKRINDGAIRRGNGDRLFDHKPTSRSDFVEVTA